MQYGRISAFLRKVHHVSRISSENDLWMLILKMLAPKQFILEITLCEEVVVNRLGYIKIHTLKKYCIFIMKISIWNLNFKLRHNPVPTNFYHGILIPIDVWNKVPWCKLFIKKNKFSKNNFWTMLKICLFFCSYVLLVK